MLMEEGRVSLLDPVEKYLPEFRAQWVIDARVFRADTLMPPYGSTQGLHLSAQAQQLLTSNQIDAVVQALASFKSSSPPGLPQSALPTAMSAGLGELQALPAMNPMNLWVDQGCLSRRSDISNSHISVGRYCQ